MRYNGYVFAIAITTCFSVFATPFNIAPKMGTSLPTTVPPGQSVTAYYTIMNNSRKTLTNNYIQYLPPSVTQVTQNAQISDLCGVAFTLTPNGTAGSSCTLELVVSGAVNANDPNPAHHLFACLPGGKSCSGTFFPLNVALTSAPEQWVVVGQMNDSQALTGTSQDGQTFQFQSVPYPPNASASAFYGVDCTNQQCVSAAQYTTTDTTSSLPGVATSDISNLSTWMQQIFPGIGSNPYGSLVSVSCKGAYCVAAGQYGNDSGLFPYIAQSADQAETWTQQLLPIIDPATYLFAFFNGVSCSGETCVAVGLYYDESNMEYSGVAYSLDNGQTWHQQVLPLVSNTIVNTLNGISCIHSTCIAVGDYIDSNDNDNPGVAITTDAGLTWSNNIVQPLPTPYSQGEWQGISCTTQYCVAVGYYSTVSYAGYLGTAVSTDMGQTWQQQVLPFSSTPANLTSGVLYGVKCKNNTCVAAGVYYDNSLNKYPVIITSTDAGKTWSQQVVTDYVGSVLRGVG